MYPQYFNPDIYTFEAVKWAYNIIDGHNSFFNRDKHLVPMFDFASPIQNPDSDTKIRKIKYNNEKNIVSLYSSFTHEGNLEVYEDYGDPNYINLLYIYKYIF